VAAQAQQSNRGERWGGRQRAIGMPVGFLRRWGECDRLAPAFIRRPPAPEHLCRLLTLALNVRTAAAVRTPLPASLVGRADFRATPHGRNPFLVAYAGDVLRGCPIGCKREHGSHLHVRRPLCASLFAAATACVEAVACAGQGGIERTPHQDLDGCDHMRYVSISAHRASWSPPVASYSSAKASGVDWPPRGRQAWQSVTVR